MPINEAMEILYRIEYSSDGFVKRYPDEKDFREAILALEKFISERDS